MSYNITLVNLPIIHRKNDPFGDIPFMPTGIVYLAGYLKKNHVPVDVVDGFGEAPRRLYSIDSKLNALGLTGDEILDRLDNPDLVGITIHAGMGHSFALNLAGLIKQRLPRAVLVAGGNHAGAVYPELLDGGFDYVVAGEGEHTLLALIRHLRDGTGTPEDIPGLVHKNGANLSPHFELDLDTFGFADFRVLPLENYWELNMSHAPIRGRYIAITTSRGCPYNCAFCTTPKLLGRKWRSRSPKLAVDEIQMLVEEENVEDVIIQDEIFGFKKENAKQFAREIIQRGLDIRLYLPSGIKVETMDGETLRLLRKAGLQYMCFSPESGSPFILKKMNKPFDYEKLYHVAGVALELGIHVGCCFILGFAGERKEDRRMTRRMIARLARFGVDEVSLFIWSPLPGAEAFKSEGGWSRYEDLNWSPAWRSNFKLLARHRTRLFMMWFLLRGLFHPVKTMRSAWNIITGKCRLKSEMAIRRLLRSYLSRFTFKRTGPKE